MSGEKELVARFLEEAGIEIDGPNRWDIQVHNERFYKRVLADQSLGLGESYMEGWWDCPSVDEFICRVLKNRTYTKIKGGWRIYLSLASDRFYNRQSLKRSRKVADQHYSLDNDLYMSFLDPYNQYSCAFFQNGESLSEAQRAKLDLICRKLALEDRHRVLDIGCGWGGWARYAARNYGCSVLGINICDEQIRYARKAAQGLPVRIEHRDYRDLNDRFDRIVSVGMFEHVGWKNYRTFMEIAHRSLEDDGVFLLQTIGKNETQPGEDPWIAKYIFPNSYLPSAAQIARAAEGLFVMEDWHNLGPHYEKTLLCWHENFQEAWPRLSRKYDERFKRMWDYYLLSCAGAFRAREIQLWQVVLSKTGIPQPPCRPDAGRTTEAAAGA